MVFIISITNFEVTFFHASSCCKFQVAKTLLKGGQEVETSNRCCLGYFLQAGIVFPKPPGHNSRNSGAKKPQYFRVAVLPACWRFQAP